MESYYSNIAKELLIGLREPWGGVFVGFLFLITKNRHKIRTTFSVLIACIYYFLLEEQLVEKPWKYKLEWFISPHK